MKTPTKTESGSPGSGRGLLAHPRHNKREPKLSYGAQRLAEDDWKQMCKGKPLENFLRVDKASV